MNNRNEGIDIETKINRVVNSCKTHNHFASALIFVEQAAKLEQISWAMEVFWRGAINKKIREIKYPGMSNCFHKWTC